MDNIEAKKHFKLRTSVPYAIIGHIIHSTEREKINIFDNGIVIVADGKIKYIGNATGFTVLLKKYNVANDQILELSSEQFVMPGLVDTHIHAPQYPNAGLGYDKSLLKWLDTYTFPLETQYHDEILAHKIYSSVVRNSLDCGTTTACYFATIHLPSSLILADIMSEFGQRGFVGKVNMNRNSPETYQETTAQSLADTEAFINAMKNKNYNLVLPVITPRFAISCDMELMKGLGYIAEKYNTHIQTHISENTGEIETVKELFPDIKTYADVYATAKLLTEKTVLAHGVWLEDEELDIIRTRGSSISHCPTSNTNLQSGLCPVRRLLNAGLKVGLGSDVSGGQTASMLAVMQSALNTSIHVFFKDEFLSPLTYHEVFYLATLGGAEALGLDNKIGNFTEGKDFDALIVDMSYSKTINLNTDQLVQKFIYTADDRNIINVFVNGNLVK